MSVPKIDFPVASQFQRPLRVVVCGEANSGKSAVINSILRSNLLPNSVGREKAPFLLVRRADAVAAPGPQALADRLSISGAAAAIPECGDDVSVFASEAPHLAGIDLIEVPALTDGELPETATKLIASADVMIWTTIASQAWRLSEKSILDELGENRPKHRYLAVTRSDKLRNETDRGKILRRIDREAAGYFDQVILMAAPRKAIEAATTDVGVWGDTGGKAFGDRLSVHVAAMPDVHPVAPSPSTATNSTVNLPEFNSRRKSKLRSDEPNWLAPVRDVALAMHGVDVVGIASLESKDDLIAITGVPQAVGAVALQCQAMLQAVQAAGAMLAPEERAPVSGQVTSNGATIQYRICKDGKLLFMTSNPKKINHGIASTGFIRITKAYENALASR